MKKAVSFTLDSDLIEFIEDYGRENNLSNRSESLNRLLLTLKISSTINKEEIEKMIKTMLRNNGIDITKNIPIPKIEENDVEDTKEEVKKTFKIENKETDKDISSIPPKKKNSLVENIIKNTVIPD